MKYVVIAEYADAKITTETNDIEVLFLEAERHRGCDHLCICDGSTGEVLMHTGDEPYCTDEFALMAMGWLMAQHWGEEEDEPEEEEVSGAEMVLALIEAMGGLPQ